MRLHAPSRREVLLASGTLFAWAHLPKLAHAEGRDPRFLAHHLARRARRACHGCAGRRSGLGRVARRQRADLGRQDRRRSSSMTFFALNPAMPNLHRMFKAKRGYRRSRLRHSVSRTFAFRRTGFARKRTSQALVSDSGWLNPGARRSCFWRQCRPPRQQGLRGRSGHPACRARPGAGAVVVAAAGAAGQRRYGAAPARSLSSLRPKARECARRECQADGHRASGEMAREARQSRSGASARLFC